MQSKLHVTNLSRLANSSTLKGFFRTCGEVLEVSIIAERAPSTMPSAAYVTMATAAGAELAVRKLHGRLFHERSLMVTLALGEIRREVNTRRVDVESKGVTIAQQYRDRRCMTYELDWRGERLTFQFLFPTDELDCRVHVRAALGGGNSIDAVAPSRELALNALSQAWQARPELALANVPWAQVSAALKSVRAI